MLPYFPPEPIERSYELDELIAGSTGALLSSFEEPPLFESEGLDPIVEAYRILCVPAFDSPYLTRLQRQGDRIEAVYRERMRQRIDPVAPIWRRPVVSLTRQQWHDREQLIERYSFWLAPLLGAGIGLDGEDWFEALSFGPSAIRSTDEAGEPR